MNVDDRGRASRWHAERCPARSLRCGVGPHPVGPHRRRLPRPYRPPGQKPNTGPEPARAEDLINRTHEEDRRNAIYNKRGTLVLVCVATAMLILDIAVVNTALPHIAHALHSGLNGVQWVVDAYTLALAAIVLSAGSLADRLGRRRIFALGMALFTASSLACRARRQHRRSRRLTGHPGDRRGHVVRQLACDPLRRIPRRPAPEGVRCLRAHDRDVVRDRAARRRRTDPLAFVCLVHRPPSSVAISSICSSVSPLDLPRTPVAKGLRRLVVTGGGVGHAAPGVDPVGDANGDAAWVGFGYWLCGVGAVLPLFGAGASWWGKGPNSSLQ